VRIDPSLIRPAESATPNVPAQPRGGPVSGPSFQEALREAAGSLKLSRHAEKRVQRRELDLDGDRMGRLQGAVDRAAEKGARNSIVMLDELAVVVDVRQRTVITAMNQEGGRDRVFTNIDSVVIA
jgi:flagellar operon protein